MLELIRELFPICRSIAGEGIRQTLRIISRETGAMIHEVPTGTQVFDWTVPQEWRLKRATLSEAASGRVIADTDVCNLHVLNYSIPFRGRLSREELKKNLHSMPDKPKWIPYRTSYYNKTWGICLADEVAAGLPDVEYTVEVDTEIKDGSLTYGELFIPGKSEREVLFSAHCCHPSLANDNLSGIAVACELAKWLKQRHAALSYRFVFIPGTIGSITWLARNVETTRRIVGGLVLSCLGDSGRFTYKKSRGGHWLMDRVAEEMLRERREPHAIRPFIPYGYDERQYCSPGFNLPVGCLMRTPNGEYLEYHTSQDNLGLVKQSSLHGSVELLKSIIKRFETLAQDEDQLLPPVSGSMDQSRRWLNLNPFCEPQLGKRGLYSMTGGKPVVPEMQMAMLWVLNFSDGSHSVDWIAGRSGISLEVINGAAERLREAGLLEIEP
jgi:aminopeptidase-like protein